MLLEVRVMRVYNSFESDLAEKCAYVRVKQDVRVIVCVVRVLLKRAMQSAQPKAPNKKSAGNVTSSLYGRSR